MRYYFDWDPRKARANLNKHKVSFEQAATVLLDPLAVTVFDKPHSEDEDRWATIGVDSNGAVLVMVHTFHPVGKDVAKIRIVSARKATRTETRRYREKKI